MVRYPRANMRYVDDRIDELLGHLLREAFPGLCVDVNGVLVGDVEPVVERATELLVGGLGEPAVQEPAPGGAARLGSQGARHQDVLGALEQAAGLGGDRSAPRAGELGDDGLDRRDRCGGDGHGRSDDVAPGGIATKLGVRAGVVHGGDRAAHCGCPSLGVLGHPRISRSLSAPGG